VWAATHRPPLLAGAAGAIAALGLAARALT
jgi:hypothetical protein